MAPDLEGLLIFPGASNIPGLCHIRVYSTSNTYVIVGELADNPGANPSVMIENVAIEIQNTIMKRPNQPFQLITHHHHAGLPVFLRVEFHPNPNPTPPPLPAGIDEQHDIVLERPGTPDARFANPRSHPIADIHKHIGETVEIRARENYTTGDLFGPEGIAIREETAAHVGTAVGHFLALAGEWQ